MNLNSTITDRRTYLAATGAATVGMVGLAGCLGGDESGTLATQVTDDPGDIGDFESCVVTVVGMWLGPEGAEAGDDEDEAPAGREHHEYDEPQRADLVELQGEATQLVDERELETTTYEFLQLDVDEIDATLEDGSAATVEVPGRAPLTFNETFDIRADTLTTFTADFTPVRRGGAGGYVLQPVPEGISVEYEEHA
ncbi:DUF4382 domain-containing protein [Halovivax sp.]|uniref:DUF4382 domain-containing protein n=1 Tax=Halovivax sp. TaxID=1935978 RepID=UPI0025C5C4EF|nr:DUF4382 domain-containing protein [Halovivax sp.]